MTATRATQVLERAGVAFSIHRYHQATAGESGYGEAVAAELGAAPARVFKTLVARVDGDPVVGIVPVSATLHLKSLARIRGGKRAEMADRVDAERLTGYVIGGISPFGHRRRLPVVADVTLRDHPTVFVSGGQRGLQVEIDPEDLIRITGARIAPIAG